MISYEMYCRLRPKLPHGGPTRNHLESFQLHENSLDLGLHRARGLPQNAQVFQVGRAIRKRFLELVVRPTKNRTRKEVFPKSILPERPGLADQPFNDMPIVDRVRGQAHEPGSILTCRAPP